jgi:hypothetical protein
MYIRGQAWIELSVPSLVFSCSGFNMVSNNGTFWMLTSGFRSASENDLPDICSNAVNKNTIVKAYTTPTL